MTEESYQHCFKRAMPTGTQLPGQENESVLSSIKLDYSQSFSNLIIPTCVRQHSHRSSPFYLQLISVNARASYTLIPPEDTYVTFEGFWPVGFARSYLQKREVITILCSHTSLLYNTLKPEVLFYSTES